MNSLGGSIPVDKLYHYLCGGTSSFTTYAVTFSAQFKLKTIQVE